MTRYEYTVIPAPQRGEKQRGASTASDRFALTLEQVLNQMGAQGWDYVRSETLPSKERSGLTSRTTVWHNVLIFRRDVAPPAGIAPTAEVAAPPPPPPPAPQPAPAHPAGQPVDAAGVPIDAQG